MFLVLVTMFLAFYFERAMAIAALVALVHDVIVTAGVYSIVGFEVSPSTVIGLLTILGFSLYDTVVVFDKVKENTRGLLGLTRRTYAEAANLALNQTLMRSINTSLIAVLPVVGLHGDRRRAARRRDAGRPRAGADGRHPRRRACPRCCWPRPLLVDLKMRDPRFREQAARVRRRRPGRVGPVGCRAEADPGGPAADPDLIDDAVLAAELRRERAMAAAAGVAGPPGQVGRAAAGRRPRHAADGQGGAAERQEAPVTDRSTREPALARGSAGWSATFPDYPAARHPVPRHHAGPRRRRGAHDGRHRARRRRGRRPTS